MGVTVLTVEVTRVGWRGTRMEYATIGGGFTGLGLKTRAKVPRRNGRHVAASGSSRRGEANGEEARWPSDQHEDRARPLRPWAYWFSSYVYRGI
jgi:hypothetical protein